MNTLTIFLIIGALAHYTFQEINFKECEEYDKFGKSVKLSLNSKKLETGDWLDVFSAVTDSSISADSMKLDVFHKAVECNGRRIVYIRGVTGSNAANGSDIPLRFHPRCGKNAAIIDDGRGAQKINVADPVNSAIFTDRPLKDDEMFEVRLEKRSKISGHSLGIGVILRPPSEINIPPEMWKSADAWIWHHTSVHTDAKAVVTKYGTTLDDVQVGSRVGVKRSRYGTLNFYINGVDQGPAVSNVPSPVYGLVELWHSATKVSIV